MKKCKYCGCTPRRGHGLCRACGARPKAENLRRLAIRKADETLSHFLCQKNISAANIETIRSFQHLDDPKLREFTDLVLEIALVKPRKRRRWMSLAEKHPEIMQRVRASPSFDWILDEADLEGS